MLLYVYIRECGGASSSFPVARSPAALGVNFFYSSFAPPSPAASRRSTTLFGITQLAEFAELTVALSVAVSTAKAEEDARPLSPCELCFFCFVSQSCVSPHTHTHTRARDRKGVRDYTITTCRVVYRLAVTVEIARKRSGRRIRRWLMGLLISEYSRDRGARSEGCEDARETSGEGGRESSGQFEYNTSGFNRNRREKDREREREERGRSEPRSLECPKVRSANKRDERKREIKIRADQTVLQPCPRRWTKEANRERGNEI